MKSLQIRDEVPMVEASGPVQSVEGGDYYYVVAIRATNNTAEVQAQVEALIWLNSCVEQKGLPISSKVMVTVDSSYVKGVIDEKFVARENRALAILLCHMWNVTKKKLQLHDGYGDTLVMLETPLLTSLRIWEHVWKHRSTVEASYTMGDWEEDGFQAKMYRFHSGAVTDTIAHSAVKMGYAKDNKSYLGSQDDTMIEMRRLCLERRRDKDFAKRKTLSIALQRELRSWKGLMKR